MDKSGCAHHKEDNKHLIIGNLLKELSQRYQGAIAVIPGPLGQDHGVIWCILGKLDITICQHPEFNNKSSYVLKALRPYELAIYLCASSEKLIIKICDSLSVHLGGFRIPVNHNNSFKVSV